MLVESCVVLFSASFTKRIHFKRPSFACVCVRVCVCCSVTHDKLTSDKMFLPLGSSIQSAALRDQRDSACPCVFARLCTPLQSCLHVCGSFSCFGDLFTCCRCTFMIEVQLRASRGAQSSISARQASVLFVSVENVRQPHLSVISHITTRLFSLGTHHGCLWVIDDSPPPLCCFSPVPPSLFFYLSASHSQADGSHRKRLFVPKVVLAFGFSQSEQ